MLLVAEPGVIIPMDAFKAFGRVQQNSRIPFLMYALHVPATYVSKVLTAKKMVGLI